MSKIPTNVMSKTTLNLKEALLEKEREFHGKDDIFGPTFLTNPGYISSPRSAMFTSQIKQFVNLNNPDFPRVFTNYEPVVGEHSTGYYVADSNMEILEIIPKFDDDDLKGHLYFVFVYDHDKQRYDVIEKRIVEDLVEKFGFSYNTENLDSKKIGDRIKKGEVLYKTPSYDDDMLYCYGKNIRFCYMLENNTIEDAIVVSESFAKNMVSKEIEKVKVSLNDNDILVNIYGDDENYKGFPDVTDMIKGKIMCAKRRIHNSQILYDLKKSNLRRINYGSDDLFFSDGKIIDIDIYCNKPLEELPDNNFNRQLIKYLKMQRRFYERIHEFCSKIIDNDYKRSKDINFLYRKSKNALDDQFLWKEEDDSSVFNHIKIEFTVERNIGLSIGQKISGRYGNKGVVSKVLPDDQMPILENGQIVHVIFNTLGVINRLNSQQLFEQSITFISERVVERLRTIESLKEKEELLLKVINYFNEEQSSKLGKYLSGLSKREKEKFFDSVDENGLYIHNPPLWENVTMFDRLTKLYKELDWIKPYDVYVNRFGRRIKIMQKMIVGSMYIMKLKQTSKKQFSARSTGSLSKKGIPEKSTKAKTHQELYSTTPIRIGDQENMNSAIGVPTELLAQLHLFYRSSPVGRRNLSERLATSIEDLEELEYSPEFSNRNIEILNAYFKAMGLALRYSDERLDITLDSGELRSHETEDGELLICTKSHFDDIMAERVVKERLRDTSCFVGTTEEYKMFIKNQVEMEKTKSKRLYINIK